jgi:hypothetical protein
MPDDNVIQFRKPKPKPKPAAPKRRESMRKVSLTIALLAAAAFVAAKMIGY